LFNKHRIPIVNIKGISSKRITVSDFKMICEFQRDVGIEQVRLFFRENLYKKIDELMGWVKENFGNNYHFVLDHNMNFIDFKRLYLSAIEQKHQFTFFMNRKITQNNKEKFLFIQGRPGDKIIRWVSLLSKKTKNGATNSILYYWLGYDVAGFTTKTGGYYVPEHELEVIKGFSYVPVSLCANEPCVIIPDNTLIQSISQYNRNKRDSVPCSAFSMVQLNTAWENFAEQIKPELVINEIQTDINHFNSL